MKKILLALMFVVSTGMLYSQTKEQASALKALEKAETEAQNPKKATNPTTWLKLATAYMDIWGLPSKNVWQGASSLEVKMLLKSEPILSTEQVNIEGVPYTVDKYADKELYYDPNGILTIINSTKRIVDGNILDKAYDALMKAHENDKSGSKSKEIISSLGLLKNQYIDEGMTAYSLSDIKKANQFFELSLKASDNPVIKGVDSLMVYYTAVTYQMLNDLDNALKYYNKCKDIGYDENGSVYGSIAEIYLSKEMIDEAKNILSAGFSKYPTNQSILINLINIYLTANEDPQKVLDLIHSAQENEPNNASLYNAEAQAYKEMGDIDKAIELYEKSYKINPDYVFGLYSIGELYYEEALEFQEEASADDISDTQYYALLEKMEESLKKAMDPFERAFESDKGREIKDASARYLKHIYFRFRDQDEKYLQQYNKYIKYLEDNGIEG